MNCRVRPFSPELSLSQLACLMDSYRYFQMVLRGWILFILLAIKASSLNAQSATNQVWFEYMQNYPFAHSFNVENAIVYSTLVESPRWRAFDYSPTLEYSLTQHIDFLAGVTVSYTQQTDDYNTVELRPVVGTRLHL